MWQLVKLAIFGSCEACHGWRGCVEVRSVEIQREMLKDHRKQLGFT